MRLRAAAKLHAMFKGYGGARQNLARRANPFELVRSAVAELQEVCNPKTEKMFTLYSTRDVKKGLREIYREIQQAGARARTVIDNLVNMVVAEHSKLIRAGTDTIARSIPIPSERDLLGDLDALQQRFGNWKLSKSGIVVRTKPIILSHRAVGEYDFGEFDITLLFALHKSQQGRYKVVAVDPKSINGHPHPHLSDNGGMCEGDANAPITHALRNGLMFEFFMIIHNTITTYNPNSPFVSLDNWVNGGAEKYDYYCRICDNGLYDDDAYTCAICGEHACENCSTWCEVGDRTVCHGCVDYYRSRTRGGCRDCGHVGGQKCVLRRNKQCGSCGAIVADRDRIRCPITGLVLCRTCLNSAKANNKPCTRDTADRRGYDVAVRQMGRRQDGVCTYVCDGTRADGAARCLLRERGYVYKPTKEPVEGSDSGTK